MQQVLKNIASHAPETFREAAQLAWLYALICGAVNYGRMDVYLGDFYATDIDSGRLTEANALTLTQSLWRLIAAHKTTFNGRVFLGVNVDGAKADMIRKQMPAMQNHPKFTVLPDPAFEIPDKFNLTGAPLSFTLRTPDTIRAAEAAARAAAAAAQAQQAMAATRLSKAILRAPIDGVVSERNVNVGDYVENMGSPAPMFRIVDARVLELTATVPSARMTELQAGQPLRFTSDALPGKEFTGAVSFINPAADETSRTVKVKAEVPNDAGTLKPGLFVKGRVVTGRRAGVLVVPRAVRKTQEVLEFLKTTLIKGND